MKHINVAVYKTDSGMLVNIERIPKDKNLFVQVVIDKSGSMLHHFETLIEAILEFVRNVKAPIGFQLFEFSCQAQLLFTTANLVETKEQCIDVIQGMKCGGLTNIEEALKVSNDNAVLAERVEVVRFFFSDGAATLGSTDRQYLSSLFTPIATNFFMFTASSDHELAKGVKNVNEKNIVSFCQGAESLANMVSEALNDLYYGIDDIQIEINGTIYSVPSSAKQRIFHTGYSNDIHVNINEMTMKIPTETVMSEATERWIGSQVAICDAYEKLKPLNKAVATDPDFDGWESIDLISNELEKLKTTFSDVKIEESSIYRSLSNHIASISELNPANMPQEAQEEQDYGAPVYRSLSVQPTISHRPFAAAHKRIAIKAM